MVRLQIIGLAFILTASAAPDAIAQASNPPSKAYEEAYRARINKINQRYERKAIERDCKAQAKTKFSAIRYNHRRTFVKECLARGGH